MLGGPYIEGVLCKENGVQNALTISAKIRFFDLNVTFVANRSDSRGWWRAVKVLGMTLNCPVYAKVDGKLHLDSN